MSNRMTKMLLALGLMAAAGQSSAMYVVGNGVYGGFDGYCGQIFYGQGQGTGVMTRTMEACTTQLNSLMAQHSNYTAVEACHSCGRLFIDMAETANLSAPIAGSGAGSTPDREVVRRFLDGTQRLREEFRIDEYERAQQELQRSTLRDPRP